MRSMYVLRLRYLGRGREGATPDSSTTFGRMTFYPTKGQHQSICVQPFMVRGSWRCGDVGMAGWCIRRDRRLGVVPDTPVQHIPGQHSVRRSRASNPSSQYLYRPLPPRPSQRIPILTEAVSKGNERPLTLLIPSTQSTPTFFIARTISLAESTRFL